jgi:2-methylisocitrate lyase-like PEP mutase family enzyme
VTDDVRRQFAELHREGLFVMPNAWDVGSARLLVSLGFPALATTSSGHAASLGRRDGQTTLDELVEHCTAICAAVDVPLSVDAEACFSDDVAGIATTVDRLAATGAAGLSIEDYDPATGRIMPVDVAVARVAAAVAAAQRHGLVLTARAENHIHGVQDLDDTIGRLVRFRREGADVVYAPGLVDRDEIARLVGEVDAPVNVLARPHGPPVPELEAVGVRRVSTGGALAFAAYGALVRAATELRDQGTSSYATREPTAAQITSAFG